VISAEEPEHVVIGLLLGSREQEVIRMGPIILQALEGLPSLLGKNMPSSGLTLVLPTLAHLDPLTSEFQQKARAKKGCGKSSSCKGLEPKGGSGTLMRCVACACTALSPTLPAMCFLLFTGTPSSYVGDIRGYMVSSQLVLISGVVSCCRHQQTDAVAHCPVPFSSLHFQACNAAIATSGSVVFELLRAKLPMAVVYRGHLLTELIAKQR